MGDGRLETGNRKQENEMKHFCQRGMRGSIYFAPSDLWKRGNTYAWGLPMQTEPFD